jgi:hypothetical protein
MQRVSTTVVCVVGAGDLTVDALARTVPTSCTTRTPLVPVADAWSRYFQGSGPVGELELVVSETLARWRAGSLELPDYYLVCSPEEWPASLRHWYLGLLAGACSFRVVTATEEPDLAYKLAALPAGRWWPELDRLLAGVDRRPPDQAGLPSEAKSAAREPEKPHLVAASRASG